MSNRAIERARVKIFYNAFNILAERKCNFLDAFSRGSYILIYVRGGIGSFAYVSRFPCPCLADYGPAEKCKWPRVIYNDAKAASTLTNANVRSAEKNL